MRVFGLRSCAAVIALCCARPVVAEPEQDSGGSTFDVRILADASRSAYHGRYTEAIALASQATAASPHFAGAYLARAWLTMQAGRYDESLADLDRVGRMHPDTASVFVLRAVVALRQRQADRALAELAHAASAPTASLWKQSYEAGQNNPGGGYGLYRIVGVHAASDMYAYTSIAQELQGHDDAALDSLEAALKNETEHPWYVLGRHCYTAAIAGLLGMAELTCTEAIARQGHDTGDYDSLGLVHLKMHQWAKAIADYDRALERRPDLTLSLYGRGIAKHAQGDRPGGDADIAAARRGEPDIAGIMTRLGVPPS